MPPKGSASKTVRPQGTRRETKPDPPPEPQDDESTNGNRHSSVPRFFKNPPSSEELPPRHPIPTLEKPVNYDYASKPSVEPPTRVSSTSLAVRVASTGTQNVPGSGDEALEQLLPEMQDFIDIDESHYGRLSTYSRQNKGLLAQNPSHLQHATVALLRQNQVKRARQTVHRLILLRHADGDLIKLLTLLELIQADDTEREKIEAEISKTYEALKGAVTPTPSQAQKPTAPVRHTGQGLTAGPTAIPTIERHSASKASTSKMLGRTNDEAAIRKPSARPQPEVNRMGTLPSDLDTRPGGVFLGSDGKRWPGPAAEVAEGLSDAQKVLYKNFSKAFVVHEGREEINRVFGVGCVILVFWHESFGSQLPSKMKDQKDMPTPGRKGPGFVSRVPNGELVYSHVRRFVVVNQRHGFSTAIPISTYGGKGLSGKGRTLPEKEQFAHTIVYALGKDPIPIKGEPDFTKDPICIVLEDQNEKLSESSRLYYAKPYTIEHNIRIKFIGRVHPDDMSELMLCYRRENFGA